MKNAIKNHMFLWKLLFKEAPFYMLYVIYNGFRYQFMIFVEHTLGIRYVLHCVEYHEPFYKALIAMVIVLLLTMITFTPDGFFQQGWMQKVKPRLYKTLKDKMYMKAADLDLACYDNPDYYNDFVLAVSESEKTVDRFLELIDLISQCVTVIVTSGIFFIFTDAAGIGFAIISFIFTLLISKALNKLNYKLRLKINPFERKRNYINRVFYIRDFAKELRLHHGMRDMLLEEFKEANEEIEKEQRKVSAKRLLFIFMIRYFCTDFITESMYILYLMFRVVVMGALDYSNAIILVGQTGDLRRSLGYMTEIPAKAHENSLYIDKIKNFLEYEPEIEKHSGEEVPEGPGELVIDNLSFRYTPQAEETLRNVSLRVKPGEKIAIVGYNGSGKTTLIKLLMRLYDPTEGTISYHGKNIKEYNLEHYHERMGVVFQDFNMYGASLKENVCLDNINLINDEGVEIKIVNALKQSGFEERLDKLTNGIDTQLTTEFDDEGVDFSGGESQKVAISRAFYKNADILIMDEPSSALDPIAEYNLNMAMHKAASNKTVFYISHRLSTTRDADRIVMLEKGRIIEEGTHEELLKKNGKYAEMWKVQASRYQD